MMRNKVSEIINAKLSYWYKTLSMESQWTIFSKTINIADLVLFPADYILSDTLWSSLVASILLGIDFSDIIPPNLQFEIELPTPEQFARGTRIIINKITLPELVPEVKDLLQVMREECYQPIVETRLTKCVWGESKVGECYVDPEAVREFFRSTMFAITKKEYNLPTMLANINATYKSLDLNIELVRTLVNRLIGISTVKDQALTWDFGWWDWTTWGEEGSPGVLERPTFEPMPVPGAVAEYEFNITPAPVKVEYDALLDMQAFGHWDDASWDLFHWAGDTEFNVACFDEVKFIGVAIQDKILHAFRSRFLTTALAVTNYQTVSEMLSPTESERLEPYALTYTQRLQLESMTERIVKSRRPDTEPATLRLYKTAVLQLYAYRSRTHGWGYEMQKTMSRDELKKFWVEKWKRQGLDESILNELFDKVYMNIDTYTSTRFRERLNFLRKRLVIR